MKKNNKFFYFIIFFIFLVSLLVFSLYSLDTTIYAAEQISEKRLKGAEFMKNAKVVSIDGLYRVYEFFAVGEYKIKKEDFDDKMFLELLQKYPYTQIFPNAKISRTIFVNERRKLF